MAQPSTRPRTGSGSTKSRAKQSANGSKARSANGSKARSTNGSKPRARASTAKRPSTAKRASTAKRTPSPKAADSGTADKVKNTLSKAKGPALAAGTAVAGAIGGTLIGTKIARKPKRVLGIPIPGTKRGFDGLATQVGKAGKQLGELAAEVRETRRKAEEVGKALS